MLTCTLTDCDKPIKQAGLCYSHYMKNWRYGTPTPEFEPKWVDVIGQRFGLLTVQRRDGQKWTCTCDCGQETAVRAGDLNRGAVTTCGDRTLHHRADVVGYSGAHERCDADRGLSRTHTCVDCGNPAKHWSYNHDDPNELLGTSGRATQIPYSLDPWHYSPRCVPCHKRVDLDQAA